MQPGGLQSDVARDTSGSRAPVEAMDQALQVVLQVLEPACQRAMRQCAAVYNRGVAHSGSAVAQSSGEVMNTLIACLEPKCQV